MKYQNDKFGIMVSIVVTVIVLGVASSISASQDDSIQPQGQTIIDRTTGELKNVPNTMQDITSDTIDLTEDLISDIPEITNEIIEESESVTDIIENTSDIIEDRLPDVPIVVEQSEGKLLELVSIPAGTGIPGCDESNTCYIPAHTMMSAGGEVIWTNDDDTPHTVTSGNPHDGPDGLFDSGLMMTGDTYSIQLDLAFEYDYFCLVHPWMQGTIVVK